MKTVLRQLGRFKRDALLCIGMTTMEVLMDILLPFITAIIIDDGLETGDLSVVYRYGAVMVVIAFLGLFFAAGAGRFAASASSGADLRRPVRPIRRQGIHGLCPESAAGDVSERSDLLLLQHR